MFKFKKGLAVLIAVCLLAAVVPAWALSNDIRSALEESVVTTLTTVVDENTTWTYLDDGSDPSANDSNRHSWATKEFDDSAWKSASGKFGSKKGALSDLGSSGNFIPTVLLQLYKNGSSGNTVGGYFFRTTVTLDADATGTLNGTFYYDDSAILYINGTRVAGFHADAITENLCYGGNGGTEPVKCEFTVDASLLKNGENIIAVEVHNSSATSSDIWFSVNEMYIDPNGEMPKEKNIALTIGADQTERNITWYEPYQESTASIQYAVKDGNDFPAAYNTVTATVSASSEAGYNYCMATIKELKPDTDYVYRLVNGSNVSQVYTFSTRDDGDFSFLFVSDPQIGANSTIGSNTTAANEADTQSWINTMNVATKKFPDTHFMICAGDQVNSGANEEQYTGFFMPEQLSSLTLSTVPGNHDNAANYSKHFKYSNATSYGVSNTKTGDYWYVYNNVLFLNINSNNLSVAEHKAFLEEAIAQNPHVLWKIVVFHHSIYSIASHSADSDIIQRRTELVPVFEELDIDVVLMGHDHTYTRTYMMNGLSADRSNGVQSSVTDPSGILYITANSSTGSKYYPLYNANAAYAAVIETVKVPSYSNVEITGTSFKITTYRVTDDTVIDTFEIKKSKANALNHNPERVAAKKATCTEDGNIEYYVCDCGRYYEDAAATKEITDKNSVVIKATGHQSLTFIARVPANCIKDGNVAHWYCSDCKNCYKDEACTKKINDVTIVSRGGHSGGETYYNDNYHWTLCENCAEPYNRSKHSKDCDCGYQQ